MLAPGVAMRLTERDLTTLDAGGERTVPAAVDPILEADRAFVTAVRSGTSDGIEVPYEEALRTHRLACALTDAARTGKPVDSAERMRVLLVGNHWTAGPGGAETVLVLTAGLLEAAGHEVTAYALDERRTPPTPAADLLPGGRRRRRGPASGRRSRGCGRGRRRAA